MGRWHRLRAVTENQGYNVHDFFLPLLLLLFRLVVIVIERTRKNGSLRFFYAHRPRAHVDHQLYILFNFQGVKDCGKSYKKQLSSVAIQASTENNVLCVFFL